MLGRWMRALCLGILTPIVQLSAQSDTSAVLELRVLDASDQAVVGAEIRVESSRGRTVMQRTDTLGLVRFSGLTPGALQVQARRLGMDRARVTLRVASGHNTYSLRLESAAIQLVGVRVVGDQVVSPRLDDFERRRASGAASAVISREDIERVNPPRLSRMLRGLGGLQLADSSGSIVAVSSRGAKPSRAADRAGFGLVQCVMRVVIDGILMPPLSNIDALVPADVHGVEVFNGPARLPPELAGLRTDNWCGVIAIWTRAH